MLRLRHGLRASWLAGQAKKRSLLRCGDMKRTDETRGYLS
jgi:hypothetical protein